MEEETQNEENFTESDVDESMKSEEEEHNPQPKDSSRDEIQSRSPLRRPPPHSKKKWKVNQGYKTSSFPRGVNILTYHMPLCIDKMV